jgi:triacylglycerol lipase
MTPLGLLTATVPSGQPSSKPIPELQLIVEDTLASAHRLWVRGRLVFPPSVPQEPSQDPPRWWQRWWKRTDPGVPPPLLRLEMRISGCSCEAEVPLRTDGRFDALLDAQLPPARRGWRMARNRVTFEDGTTEKCGLVLMPPENASGVVVVVLPQAYSLALGGPQRLARSEQAGFLTTVLRQLYQGPRGVQAIYYVAGVPADLDSAQVELALATTTLGWPNGHLVLFPCTPATFSEGLTTALDRLRWLFAGPLTLPSPPRDGGEGRVRGLDFAVLNLEPEAVSVLHACLEAKEDRAPVQRLLNPADDPWGMLGESRPEPSQPSVASLRPTRAGLVPRHPIVFCHGMLALSTLRMQLPEELNCFAPLREFLRERGCRVLFPQVTPTGGVAARAEELRQQIRRWTDEPINLIAHSMGGLDARYLITHLDMAPHVRTLTTIATPHHGTYLADWFHTAFRQRLPLLLALQAIGVNVDGFRDCRLADCRDFNERTPDRPEVRYFSLGGAVPQSRVSPALRRAWTLLTPVEGANDGMVSTSSARWGEYLGTVNADHYAQTPDSLFLRPGEDFDALGFYCRLVEDLARRGY